MFQFPRKAAGQISVCSLRFGVNSVFIYLFFFLESSISAQNIGHKTKNPGLEATRTNVEFGTRVGREQLPMSQKMLRQMGQDLKLRSRDLCSLLQPHCSSVVPVGGGTYTAYSRLPEFGPKSVNPWAVTHRMHFPSSAQTAEPGEIFWQSIRMRYGLLTFVILKKEYLKYKFKRQKWLLCMRSNCLCKNLNGVFSFFLLCT